MWAFERPQKSEVIGIIHAVNQTWQQRHPTHGDFFWNRAAYYIGNLHAYEATGTQAYKDYATAWAEHNNWRGREGSSDPTEWLWSYGESYNYVLFGDNQVCFQVYADLYNMDEQKDERKIARALEVMGYEISTDEEGYLWWVDGLFMVMPIMTKLYHITGNPLYLEKMYAYWKWYTTRMFDEEEGLYYRDANYVYPQHTTLAGKKDFWARGDGWIFAAFAKVIQDLPEDHSHREEYISYYRRMAAALKQCQQQAGYWERSLIDPEQAPGYETSGTAFFTYGYAWGIGSGILQESEYGETLSRAWNYLKTIALQPDGTVGYIQPIGAKAIPGQMLYPSSYYDFGVGAFLMAASEMSKLAEGQADEGTPQRVASAELDNDGKQLKLTFINAVNANDALSNSKYTIDGQWPKNATIKLTSTNTVTINMGDALEYGKHSLTVSGVRSADGGVMVLPFSGEVFRAVALDQPETGWIVTAIGAQDGNPAVNAFDGNYNTRWSQDGKRQWIQIDMLRNHLVTAVDLAFYNGDKRQTFFEIETAADDNKQPESLEYQPADDQFTIVIENQRSSGLTTQLERYMLPQPAVARFVRIVCNQNTQNVWNSITEIRVRYDSEYTDGIRQNAITSPVTSSPRYDLQGRPAQKFRKGWKVSTEGLTHE